MNKNKKTLSMICPICGEKMEEYEYGYDNHVYGKIYLKCSCCGHKTAKIL